jgi:acetyl esterase/lipase
MAQLETLHPDLWLIGYLPEIAIRRSTVRVLLRALTSIARGPNASSEVIREDLVIQSAPDAQGQTKPIKLFLTRPAKQRDGPLPVILWIHGGGLVTGSHKEGSNFMDDCAKQFGALVVSPDYRLAPDHPAPAAQEDCFAAWQWLVGQARERNLDLDRMVVGGVSAGGGLAAAVAQRIHDQGGPQPKLQVLIYPMLNDATATKPKPKPNAANYIWTHDSNVFGWTSYLNAVPGSPDVPQYAVPARRQDLSGLPPAWIGCGTMDLFIEEDLEYARRLEAAGIAVQTHIVPRACHGFDSICPKSELSIKFAESYMEAIRRAWKM